MRGAEPPVAGAGDLAVQRVERETADEWAEFLQRVYGLDTGPWLQQLIGRPGWHQYVARESGEIVAARAMFVGPDGTAWLGMDGPVPGLGTDDYERDAAICARIVADGLAAGATRFIADIEAPSETMDTPAYANFAWLGFRRPYERLHLCLRAADGILLVDTCPSREAFEAFAGGTGFRTLRERHGLPQPERLDDFPVHRAFVDGAPR